MLLIISAPLGRQRQQQRVERGQALRREPVEILAGSVQPAPVVARSELGLPLHQGARGGREALPEDVADLATFYYLTGWRNAEPRSLRWDQVSWFRKTLTLDARFSKNGEPLEYPFGADPDLEELLRRRRKVTDEAELRSGAAVPWIFHRQGRPIRSFWNAWAKACERIGLPAKGPRSLRPHDFRRARARDLMDATADPFLTCELVGWKSLDMLARYRITNTADREGALAKVRALREARQAALEAVPKVGGEKS